MQTLELPSIDILAETALDLAGAASIAEDRTAENALNKAMMQLHLGVAPVATVGGFLISSRTSNDVVYRISNVYGCNCEAGRHGRACWHQAVLEIIEVAQTRTLPALPSYEEAVAAMNEVFA